MTDLRHTNDVCFIQQQQQQQQTFPQQQHKSLTVLRESFRTNCNSNSQTPESLQLSAKEQYHSQPQQSQQLQHMRVQQQNPLLQSLIDYTHSLATQQPTTVTAIGQQQQQHYNGTSFGGIPPMDDIQFDEHEIYYVSPTKRKTSFRSQQQQQQQQRFRISSPIRNTINCNQSVPTSTTTTTTLDHVSRLAGVVHDFSLDDTSSHYSDTAVQLLRSGSVSGSLGDTNNTSRLKNFATTLTSNNNCRSHSSSSSSLATTVHFQNNHNHNHHHHHHYNNNGIDKFSQQNPSQHYQGSLQRSKGRSSQSLCSCDAALDTEINLDSTRPLYQYDVEGKRTHTYSCEQNAQILMRLERERKRKFSLGADVETATTTMTTASRAKNDKTQKSEIFDMNFDNIPPVPPPPILKLHASKLGLQFLQHQQQQQQKTIDNGTKNYNGRNGTLEALCTNDVGSLLDDCTASILKCANTISDELGFTASPSLTGKSLLANTTREKSSKSLLVQNHQLGSRPDSLSAFNKYLQISGHSSSHDDIIMPKSQKTDLSLCFLHAKGGGGSSETRTSTSLNVEPYLHTGIDSRRNFNKYNTVGASSDYAKHWSTYRQQMLQREQLQQEQQEQTVNIGTNHCRCFSKSLSSFPMRTYFDTTQAEFSGLDSGINNQQILHSNAENQPPLASSAYPPIVTNSSTTKNNRFHVPTNVFNSSCNYKVAPKPPINALNEASFITLNDSTNSGLNHHQHQHHHHSHQPNVYQQNSPHPQRKQKQQHQHQHEHEYEHGQLNVQYSHHDYLLHNNKANILGLHKQSPLRNHQHHHNIHHAHHHHQQLQHQLHQQQQQQQQPLQEKHLAMPTNVTNLMPWKHRQCPSRCSSSSGTNSLRKSSFYKHICYAKFNCCTRNPFII